MKRSLSWPTILISAVALLLGSLGVAAAGPAAKKLTTHQVKSIAAKVVHQKAGKLRVAKAKNAAKLGGRSPSAYRDRVVMAGTTTPVPVPGPGSELLSTRVSTPDGGWLSVSASTTFTTPGISTSYSMWTTVGGACAVSGDSYDNRVYDNTASQATTSFDFIYPVGSGSHKIRLCANGRRV